MAQILAIDDEPQVRKILRRWIEHTGHTCVEAGTADEALRVLADTPVDMAFCDIQMPGHSGIWLTGEIRTRYPMVPVVLATSVSTVSPSVSMRAGVLAYLLKPFSRTGVEQALSTGLQWRDATLKAGPHPDDVGDKLAAWLDTLNDL